MKAPETPWVLPEQSGGSREEQAAEVVQNGMSGTIVGRGKPASSGLTDLMRRRGAKPTRGAPIGIVFLRFHFPSKELAWMRVTEGAANLKRDVQPSSQGGGTNSAKTPRANIERCKAAGGETKATQVSSRVREALKRRRTPRVMAAGPPAATAPGARTSGGCPGRAYQRPSPSKGPDAQASGPFFFGHLPAAGGSTRRPTSSMEERSHPMAGLRCRRIAVAARWLSGTGPSGPVWPPASVVGSPREARAGSGRTLGPCPRVARPSGRWRAAGGPG